MKIVNCGSPKRTHEKRSRSQILSHEQAVSGLGESGEKAVGSPGEEGGLW